VLPLSGWHRKVLDMDTAQHRRERAQEAKNVQYRHISVKALARAILDLADIWSRPEFGVLALPLARELCIRVKVMAQFGRRSIRRCHTPLAEGEGCHHGDGDHD